jgi:hypothetical protein
MSTLVLVPKMLFKLGYQILRQGSRGTLGDGEMGRWGDGERGRWGENSISGISLNTKK